MSKSISLLRTNPALTTNVKLVVSKKYDLFLESYNTNRELSNDRFKKFNIRPEDFLSERIARFYRNIPSEIAFDVKNDIDIETAQNDYDLQYDDIYYSGALNVEDNRYKEEFQYNTTLKIGDLPKHFFIFRCDGVGMIDFNNNIDYFKNLKLIHTYDLTEKTDLGKLWKKNYIDDDELPRAPIELNFRRNEFSSWNGYNYKSGGTQKISFFLEEYFRDENDYYNLEKFIVQGFRKNDVIAANYTNVSFLFDDTVADVFIPGVQYFLNDHPYIYRLIQRNEITTEQYSFVLDNVTNEYYYVFNDYVPFRKRWSTNRYSGFYADDLKYIDQVSPYIGVKFKTNQNIVVQNNVFLQNNTTVNPVDGVFTKDLPVYLKIKNKFYLVELNENNDYVIVSDELINGNLDDLIQNQQEPIKIEFELDQNVSNKHQSYLKFLDNSYYWNDNFNLYENGVCIIEIDETMYSLYFDINNEKCYINTDEYIVCNNNQLFRKLGNENAKSTNVRILTEDDSVMYFKLYFIKFTEIKDFDFDRTDTVYTKQEYEINNNINYNRPGIYKRDINDQNFPMGLYFEKNYNIYLRDGNSISALFTNGNDFLLPLASEYAAMYDLYKLDKMDNLSDIWSVNQYVNKWGINNSINNNSYPYKINNNLTVSGQYNFTSNLYTQNVNINQLNLDYFFTLGQPLDYNEYNDPVNNFVNYSSNTLDDIIFRTLNIDLDNIFNSNTIHDIYKFDINFIKC